MPDIDVITDETGLAALWPAWDALWRRVPRAWPFTAPAWLHPWWQHFGTRHPVVAVQRMHGALSALLPLYRLNNKLLPMGVGISDYFDVLLAPEAPADSVTALLAAALHAGGTTRCDLPELPPQAALLRAQAPDGWHSDDWESACCPVMALAPQPAIAKGRWRDLRQARHRADRAGGWHVRCADADTIPALLHRLIALHTARWQAVGQPGLFADPRVSGFHRDAAPMLLQAGLLRIAAIELRGQIAAVTYALLADDRIGFYLTGFDPEAAYESPGTILLGSMLEQASREGRQEAHFLRGDEPYKLAWGALPRRSTGRSFIRA